MDCTQHYLSKAVIDKVTDMVHLCMLIFAKICSSSLEESYEGEGVKEYFNHQALVRAYMEIGGLGFVDNVN